jgi:hypothetical protein
MLLSNGRLRLSWLFAVDDNNGCYQQFSALLGIIAFCCSWWYCAATYGFLWGFGFGWVPSIIIGLAVAALWPLAAFALFCFVIYINAK